MSKRRQSYVDYNPHPEPESLSEVREALMTRMDIMERNLGRVITRVLNEVNALRKENKMLQGLLKRTRQQLNEIADGNGCSESVISEIHYLDDDDDEKSIQSEEHFFKKEMPQKIIIKKEKILDRSRNNISKMFTKFDDPLDEMESQYNTVPVEFDPSTFHTFEPVLPKKPFTKVEEFEDFENDLMENEEKVKSLVIEFQNISNSQGDKYIRQCLRSIITDRVASQFTFRGTLAKKNFSVTKTTAALKIAFINKFGDFPEVFEKTVATFFHYAKDRIVKLERYHQKRHEESINNYNE